MWSRLLPLLLILICLLYLAVNFQNLRRELVYKLGISGDSTIACCNVADILKSDGSFNENANLAIFNSQQVDYPKTSLAYGTSLPDPSQVLGTTNSSGEEKWIEISLSQQHLWAREGSRVIIDFPVSSGKWAPTPTGTFNIWYKTRYQSMIGGSKELGTYYNLPNVPNNMFFYQGFAIHGAYWHNNFGHPMSHGCVNSPLSSVTALFDWTGPNVPPGQNAIRATAENPGTRVWIHE